MRYYTGLDVSQKATSICIVDENGKIVTERSLETCPFVIGKFLKETGLTFVHVGLETGHHSHWLEAELKKQGYPVVCICALRLSKFLSAKYNKNDRNDARGTAEALRLGAFHPVYLKSQEEIELRLLLTSRESIANQKKQASNKIRGLLKPLGVRSLGESDKKEFIQNIRDAIKDSVDNVKLGIEALISSFLHQKQLLEELDKEIEKIAKSTPDAVRLMTAPGVGPVTALYFLVEIGDPHRFKSARAVGAYLGMTPRLYESGEVSRQGGISKCGSKRLRSLLRNAGLSIMSRCTPSFNHKTWGYKKVKKIGKQKVYIAVGRKMAGTLWSMLLNQKDFDYRDTPTKKKRKTKKRNELQMVVAA